MTSTSATFSPYLFFWWRSISWRAPARRNRTATEFSFSSCAKWVGVRGWRPFGGRTSLFVGCPGACAVDGAAAGVARLFIRWLARRGEARLRFGARLPSQNGFSSGPLVSHPSPVFDGSADWLWRLLALTLTAAPSLLASVLHAASTPVLPAVFEPYLTDKHIGGKSDCQLSFRLRALPNTITGAHNKLCELQPFAASVQHAATAASARIAASTAPAQTAHIKRCRSRHRAPWPPSARSKPPGASSAEGPRRRDEDEALERAARRRGRLDAAGLYARRDAVAAPGRGLEQRRGGGRRERTRRGRRRRLSGMLSSLSVAAPAPAARTEGRRRARRDAGARVHKSRRTPDASKKPIAGGPAWDSLRRYQRALVLDVEDRMKSPRARTAARPFASVLLAGDGRRQDARRRGFPGKELPRRGGALRGESDRALDTSSRCSAGLLRRRRVGPDFSIKPLADDRPTVYVATIQA